MSSNSTTEILPTCAHMGDTANFPNADFDCVFLFSCGIRKFVCVGVSLPVKNSRGIGLNVYTQQILRV